MTRTVDVFETCVIRAVWPVGEIYRIVGDRSHERWSQSWNGERFARERQAAEIRCFAHIGASYTLERIYAELVLRGLSESLATAVLKLEEEVELEMARPVAAVHSQIEKWKRAGDRILFVSNTYLRRELIRDILRTVGLAVQDDEVIVSNEFGAMKRRGRLFRKARGAGALPCRVATHLGNCAIADVAGARWAGIWGMAFVDGNADVLEAFLESQLSPGFRTPAWLAGARRIVRLGDPSLSAQSRFGSGFCGLVALLFLIWIVQRCREAGVTRVYILARDGWLLKRMTEMPEFRRLCSDLSFCYLYGSRISFGLTGDRQCDSDVVDCYLRQEGFLAEESVGIVDVGWRGSLIRHLSARRIEFGRSRSLGLFFGVDDVEATHEERSNWVHLLSPRDFPSRVPGRIDPNVKFFVESILQAPHGTTLGYREQAGRLVPELADTVVSLQHMTRLQDYAIAFARTVFGLCPSIVTDSRAPELLVPFLHRFAQKPTREEALVWGEIEVESESGCGESRRASKLAEPFTWWDLARLPQGRSALASHPNEWRAGRVARSGFVVRKIAQWAGAGTNATVSANVGGSTR